MTGHECIAYVCAISNAFFDVCFGLFLASLGSIIFYFIYQLHLDKKRS